MTIEVHDIEQLQAMDEAAWGDLQEDYFRRVYFFVKRYVTDHQTAEDITQDVFLGAVKGISKFDPSFTLEQFLFGIAKNRVIDHFRKHKMRLIPAKGEDDRDRSGIVVSEGGCLYTLERLDDALARGARIHAELVGLIEAGFVRPPIGQVFPLDEIAAAYRVFQNREAIGKVILQIR